MPSSSPSADPYRRRACRYRSATDSETLEGEVVTAGQFGHDLEFLAAAIQAEGAHEVVGERGLQIMADEI